MKENNKESFEMKNSFFPKITLQEAINKNGYSYFQHKTLLITFLILIIIEVEINPFNKYSFIENSSCKRIAKPSISYKENIIIDDNNNNSNNEIDVNIRENKTGQLNFSSSQSSQSGSSSNDDKFTLKKLSLKEYNPYVDVLSITFFSFLIMTLLLSPCLENYMFRLNIVLLGLSGIIVSQLYFSILVNLNSSSFNQLNNNISGVNHRNLINNRFINYNKYTIKRKIKVNSNVYIEERDKNNDILNDNRNDYCILVLENDLNDLSYYDSILTSNNNIEAEYTDNIISSKYKISKVSRKNSHQSLSLYSYLNYLYTLFISNDIRWFLVFFLINSISIGMLLSNILNICLEYLPTNTLNKNYYIFFLISITSKVVSCIINKILISKKEEDNNSLYIPSIKESVDKNHLLTQPLNIYSLFLLVFYMIIFILTAALLKDSPENLIIRSRITKGLSLLKSIVGTNKITLVEQYVILKNIYTSISGNKAENNSNDTIYNNKNDDYFDDTSKLVNSSISNTKSNNNQNGNESLFSFYNKLYVFLNEINIDISRLSFYFVFNLLLLFLTTVNNQYNNKNVLNNNVISATTATTSSIQNISIFSYLLYSVIFLLLAIHLRNKISENKSSNSKKINKTIRKNSSTITSITNLTTNNTKKLGFKYLIINKYYAISVIIILFFNITIFLITILSSATTKNYNSAHSNFYFKETNFKSVIVYVLVIPELFYECLNEIFIVVFEISPLFKVLFLDEIQYSIFVSKVGNSDVISNIITILGFYIYECLYCSLLTNFLILIHSNNEIIINKRIEDKERPNNGDNKDKIVISNNIEDINASKLPLLKLSSSEDEDKIKRNGNTTNLSYSFNDKYGLKSFKRLKPRQNSVQVIKELNKINLLEKLKKLDPVFLRELSSKEKSIVINIDNKDKEEVSNTINGYYSSIENQKDEKNKYHEVLGKSTTTTTNTNIDSKINNQCLESLDKQINEGLKKKSNTYSFSLQSLITLKNKIKNLSSISKDDTIKNKGNIDADTYTDVNNITKFVKKTLYYNIKLKQSSVIMFIIGRVICMMLCIIYNIY